MRAKSSAAIVLALVAAGCASSDERASVTVEAVGQSRRPARSEAILELLRVTPGMKADLDARLSLVSTPEGWILGPVPPHAGFRAAGYRFLDATLPTRAGRATTLVRRGVPGFSLEIAALDLSDVPGEVVHGAVVFADAQPGIDVVLAASGAGVEELRVVRTATARVVLRHAIRLGEAVADVRVVGSRVELLDASRYSRIETAPIVAFDANGTQRALSLEVEVSGRNALLRSTLDAHGLVPPIVIDPMWVAAAKLGTAREQPTATRLGDDTVLVTGGKDFGSAHSAAEVYAPKTATWSAVGAMAGRRQFHAAALLASGKVLVSGGFGDTGTSAISSAEIYDPAAKTFSSALDMAGPRGAHTATTLVSGKVLVVGGEASGSPLSTAQLFDPGTGAWSAAASMAGARTEHTATRLIDGRVLVAGGRTATSVLATAEIYDPAKDSWTTVGPLKTARWGHSAHLLPDGSVLAVGGFKKMNRAGINDAERFVPAGKTWAPIDAKMNRYRGRFYSATLQGGARVVVAGGLDYDESVPVLYYRGVSDVFGSATEQWIDTDTLLGGRGNGASVAISNVEALAIGGSEVGTPTQNVDIFSLLPNGTSCLPAGGFEYRCANFCVDLVCCESACDDPCSTCAVPATLGKCVPVALGTPVAPRSCGVYTRCVAGKCITSCTKDEECIASHFCSAGTCIARKPIGSTCAAPGECASRNCVDGVCCDTSCEGACESCKLPGKLGECSAVLDGTAPPRDERACKPYVCGASGCRTSCTIQAHCLESARCVEGRCVDRTRECSGDGLASIEWSSGAGLATPCGAYRCGSDGRCHANCGGTGDCAPDHVCNLGNRTCVPADRSREGCATGPMPRPQRDWPTALLLGGLVLLARRRRR